MLSPHLALPQPRGDFSGSGRAPPLGRRAGSGGTPLQGSFSWGDNGSNANVKPASVLDEPAAGLETHSSPRALGADSCGTTPPLPTVAPTRVPTVHSQAAANCTGADSCGTHFSRRDEVASLVRPPRLGADARAPAPRGGPAALL